MNWWLEINSIYRVIFRRIVSKSLAFENQKYKLIYCLDKALSIGIKADYLLFECSTFTLN